ncbi:Nucleolar protein 16 [Stygiomarasmius scandens]|uniref:Nucleolar protein 16 n=1 Tax=Marasmiellus scandens TaxID=2682957 RepID=A0ABR1IVR1_9AGAR
MANPRQRRKARSSSHRPVSQSKNAKRNLKKTPPIRGPKLLQQAWDKHKTVRQNYATLGLIHDLNPTESGGTERTAADVHITNSASGSSGVNGEAMASQTETLTSNVVSVSEVSTASSSRSRPDASVKPSSNTLKNASIPTGYGRIIRDANGNIVDVQLAEGPEDEEDDSTIEGDVDMEQMTPELDDNAREKWVSNLGSKSSSVGGTEGAVVKDLEKLSTLKGASGTTLSASMTGVGARYASQGEVAYFERLVEKYGTDVERMARDRKLNSEQRTVGELRRGLVRAGMLS